MKRLLGTLLVITFTTSALTTTVACDKFKEDYIFPLEVSTILSSTTDISSIMMLQKSENLGLNVADPFGEEKSEKNVDYSKGVLERFKYASSFGTDDYANKKAQRYSLWSTVFSSESNDSDVLDGVRTSDFIEKNSMSKGLDKLGYLLSDDTRKKYYGDDISGDVDYYRPDNIDTTETYSANIKTYLETYNDSSAGFLDVLAKPSKSGIDLFLSLINNFVGLAMTDPDAAPSGGITTWYGQVYKMFIGQTTDSFIANYNTTDYNGDTLGYLSACYELIYSYAKNNKSSLLPYFGDDVYNLLFGTSEVKKGNNQYLLIKPIEGKNARKREDNGAGKIVASGETNTTFFSAYENTGLYGELINKIGNIKYHTKENVEADRKLSASERYLDAPKVDKYDCREVLIEDTDLIGIIKLTREIYEIGKQKLPEQDFAKMVNIAVPKIPIPISVALRVFGIDVSKYLDSLLDLMFTVMDGFVRYVDPKDGLKAMDVNGINSYFNSTTAFDTSVIRNLKSIANDYLKSANIFDNKNAEYLKKLKYELGVDIDAVGEDIWIKNRAYTNIRDGIKNHRFDKILADLDFGSAAEELTARIDKPLIDWFSVKVIYNKNNSIKEISYDLIYDGFGNADVQQFKVDNFGKYEPSYLLDKLQSDKKFKKQYIGTNTEESLKSKVKNRYHMVWVNESTSSMSIDMKLKDITSSEAYINNKWIEMLI